MLVNGGSKSIRASAIVVSRDAVALLLNIDPDNVIAWDVSSGQLHVAYRDDERGMMTPPDAVFCITRRMSVETTRAIKECA
jgi:hypothetical protein